MVSAIIIVCDRTTTEASKFIDICYDIQEQLPSSSSYQKGFMLLINIVKDTQVRFTAANYFEINRRTFFGLLSVSATYFIIIIQFN